MLRIVVCTLTVMLALETTPPAIAGDPAAGKKIVGQCATCHGQDGVGRMPDVPNLAGESTIYLTKELNAYRSGERDHPQMSIIAKGLSDEQIADLAAWYAALKVTVEMPDL
ncbi:cytochrome c-554 (plasmid) [Sinorhizobium fredii NGR234]|uniref:Cytochrome c-554 n=1 Tax=Sinorhizobium fredii (strain NBRC 101917 / NGR234) TaxID=394 RepID=C3KMX9_SINFN|nr:cytochrome c [Sinorhizobium fredii]ACP21552.1 cytochrome c-554 [Sinorhizobium fredii NGR234]